MGNKRNLTLLLAAAMVFAIFALPGEAAKASEPSGNLVITSADQLVVKIPGYVRVYNWQNGQFVHVWSGIVGDNFNPTAAAIGDIDNDGVDDVVASSVVKSGSKYTYSMKIWQNGDSSGSPSITTPLSGTVLEMMVGDVDNDGNKELVVLRSARLDIFDCTSTACSLYATVNVGSGGLTIGDADNDGANEILVGMTGSYCNIAVVKYANGAYSIVALLGQQASGCCMDMASVGDINGVAGNEIFGSGYCSGNLYVWQYSGGAYNQLWNGHHNTCFDQTNAIADIDGDGSKEIVFTSDGTSNCGTEGSKVSVYRYAGNNVWTRSNLLPWRVSTPINMAVSGNPDGDSAQEMVIFNTVWDWVSGAFTQIQTYMDTTLKSVSMG